MPLYDVSARTTLVTATIAAPLASLRASTTRVCRLRELGIFGITAPTTSGSLGLCLATALGTGTLTSVTPVSRDRNSPAAGAIMITNWATAVPTNGGVATMFKRWAQSVAIGNGIIWTWDMEPFEIPLGNTATGELCICNLLATAPGTFEIFATFSE